MEQKHISHDVVLPTWVVSTDDVLIKDIELVFKIDRTFRLQGNFRKWQTAVKHLNGAQAEGMHQRAGEVETKVVVVDDEFNAADELNWLKILRESDPDALVVVLMHKPADDHIAAALNSGAAALLEKPIKADRLISAVKAALDGAMVISPSVMAHVARVNDPALLSKWESLTRREKEVLSFLAKGCSVKEIADSLCVSFYTAQTHIRNIHRKLTIGRSASLVVQTLRDRLPVMNYSC